MAALAISSRDRREALLVGFALPTLVSFAVAAFGGGLLGSWVAAIPYFVVAEREFWCYGGGDCIPPPTVQEALPGAIASALIPGLMGYVCYAIADRRHEEQSVQVALLYLVVAGLLVSLAALFVPWHPLLDPLLDRVGW